MKKMEILLICLFFVNPISASINDKIRSRCKVFISESFVRLEVRGDGIASGAFDFMVERFNTIANDSRVGEFELKLRLVLIK